tara:strand:- start:12640 stop:12852 length:213 start_codon:yes stop_codon:yes gene_type:complete
MKEIIILTAVLAEEPDSSKFPTPEHILNTHPTYSVVASADVKKKKKKGRKLAEKGKKKKKGFFSKVFGSK